MVEIEKPILKCDFINALKKSEDPFTITNEKIYQITIYVKQQGAGNGKTYGIIQLINDNEEFKTMYKSEKEKINAKEVIDICTTTNYNIFVYLTKQHSAKHIIKCEIEDQVKRGLYKYKILLSNINR